jgi:hypothetical protein
LLPEEPGLIEKFPERDGLSGAYFRLTQAGVAKKAKHASRLENPLIPFLKQV